MSAADKVRYYRVSVILFFCLFAVNFNIESKDFRGIYFWENNWRLIASSTDYTPRDGAAVIEFDEQAWMFGGWTEQGTTNEIWSSKDLKNWVKRGEAPWSARHLFGLVKFQNKLWAIGGDYKTDIWKSEDGVVWDKVVDEAPWGRRYSSYVCIYKDKMWLMGGQLVTPIDWDKQTDQKVMGYNDVWQSADGKKWNLVTAHAAWAPRAMIQGCLVDENKMYILGGGLKAGMAKDGKAQTQVEYNDIWETGDGESWKRVVAAAPWKPRTHFSVIKYKSNYYLTDGSVGTQENLSNEVWVSENMTDWRELGHSPFSKRHASSLFTFKDDLYLANGYIVNDIWKLKTK